MRVCVCVCVCMRVARLSVKVDVVVVLLSAACWAVWGSASPLLWGLASPVGFDCFDVAHQVLSQADPKYLQMNTAGKEMRSHLTA